MPRQSADAERMEIVMPQEVAAALREKCPAAERNRWVVTLIARALRIRYTPRGRGRPRKHLPDSSGPAG